MKLFATRVWGYDPRLFPIASFGSEGLCNHLLRKSTPGDRLVFVGTKGPPTAPHEQGNILGYIEFGRDVINTLDVSDPANYPSETFDKKGNFKWPRALVATRAWKIDTTPLPGLVATIGRQFSRDATTMAVDLSKEEAKTILALPVREVALPESETLTQLQRQNARLGPNGRSHSPVPSARIGGEYTPGQTAWTYAMQFGVRACFKVGWSTDPQRRLAKINQHVPSEILNEAWALRITQKWPHETAAHQMEQAILDALPQDCINGERVAISTPRFEKIWNDYMYGSI